MKTNILKSLTSTSFNFPPRITVVTHHLLQSLFSCDSIVRSGLCLRQRWCDMCGWQKFHVWTELHSADVILHFSHLCHCDLSSRSSQTQVNCWLGGGDTRHWEHVCAWERHFDHKPVGLSSKEKINNLWFSLVSSKEFDFNSITRYLE